MPFQEGYWHDCHDAVTYCCRPRHSRQERGNRADRFDHRFPGGNDNNIVPFRRDFAETVRQEDLSAASGEVLKHCRVLLIGQEFPDQFNIGRGDDQSIDMFDPTGCRRTPSGRSICASRPKNRKNRTDFFSRCKVNKKLPLQVKGLQVAFVLGRLFFSFPAASPAIRPRQRPLAGSGP